MFWNIYQQSMLASTAQAVEEARSKVDRQARNADDLQRHVERLSLACQAMWELLRQRTGVSEEDLEKKILEIDLRDGRVDGKLGPQPVDCPACGRKTGSKRGTCIMCGAPIKRPHQFDG